MKIVPANIKYWKDKGYRDIKTGGRGGINSGLRLKVKVSELNKGSWNKVSCRCNTCKTKYVQYYKRNTETCNKCSLSKSLSGNKHGKANLGKSNPKGELSHRWNPNKSEYKKYCSKVRSITELNYKADIDLINPDRHPRKICGADGGYQLDHIISVKRGFLENIDPSIIGCTDNLRVIPWKENRDKWH